MKTVIKIRYGIIAFVFFSLNITFSDFSFCQAISTVSEIYNYNINDIFHVHEFGSSQGNGFSIYSDIQITNKYYSANNDTLFYTRFIKTATSTSDNPPWVYDSYTDNIFYTKLDSLINDGNIDSVYFDTLYNGRKINYADYVPPIISNGNKFIDGCGGPYYYYSNPDPYVYHYFELLYFLKGTEVWGEPYYVSIDENSFINQNFNIFPNPATDNITIATSKKSSIEILNINGQIIKTIINDNGDFSIDIGDLPSGIYIVKAKTDKKILAGKIIKE